MYYEIKTFDGLRIKMEERFKLDAYLSTINNPRVEAVAIGTVSTLKHNIQNIRPVYEDGDVPVGDKVLVYSARGNDSFIAHVEEYSAGNITDQVNNQIAFIKIGDVVINRHDFSLTMPYQ